jgi:prepilin-type N-terminal cleavage/methylation domain-containing protein
MSESSRRMARRGEQGFTLVEALTAIVILSFGLMAVTNLLVVAASSNSVANQSTAAADMAARQMEALKLAPWNDAQLNPGGGFGAGACAAYCRLDDIPGVGRVETRWQIDTVDVRTRFIRVRSEGRGALSGPRSRAEFTTFRSCTMPQLGCP